MAEIESASGWLPQTQDKQSWVWQHPDAAVHWVFGVSWFPTLSRRSERLLERQLRAQGMHWSLTHGASPRLIGAVADARANEGGPQPASAAIAFASCYGQGAQALCLEVTGQGVWLVACIDGRLLSQTDCWFAQHAHARDALEPLIELHPHMQVQELVWDGLADGPDFLQAAGAASRFARLSDGRVKPVILGVAASLLVLVTLAVVWPQAEPDVRQTQVPQTVTHRVNEPMVHAIDDLVAIAQSWHHLPIDPAGWLLEALTCRVQQEQLQCRAQYRRRATHANNEGLQEHQPHGWQLQPDNLEHAAMLRTYPLAQRPWREPLAPNWHDGLTQLQRFSDQVAQLTVSDRRAPAVDENAPTVPHQGLVVRLPLRQSPTLNSLQLPISWREMNLHMIQGADLDARHGYLMLELKGDWYARR